MKVVTAVQMQKIDSDAGLTGLTTDILMENAGRTIAQETRNLLNGVIGKSILILVGPGNNGGDGLVAARYLDKWDAEVTLYLCSQRKSGDKNLEAAAEQNIPVVHAGQDNGLSRLRLSLESAGVVIDAIFGTGNSRPIEGAYKTVLDIVNEIKSIRPSLCLIAVDLPSGLNADTGAVDPACPQANATITLGLPKPGLYSYPGAGKAGKVIIVDIGIPPTLTDHIKTELIERQWVGSQLPVRPPDANKGSSGKLMAAIGSINYTGAAYLACMGAYRSGAGLVTLAAPETITPIVAAKMAETTYFPLNEAVPGILSPAAVESLISNLTDYNVLLIGCGLGQHPETIKAILSILSDTKLKDKVTVIDADALNALSTVPTWWQMLGEHVILTPHPGEMSRLTSLSISEIQGNRLALTMDKAREWGKIVVLKGAYTVIASPDGRAGISTAVNPGLASAGTGDVLAGIIAALAAQGMPTFEAAACGVFIHSEAGLAVANEIGNTGMMAGDLLPVIPKITKQLKEDIVS